MSDGAVLLLGDDYNGVPAARIIPTNALTDRLPATLISRDFLEVDYGEIRTDALTRLVSADCVLLRLALRRRGIDGASRCRIISIVRLRILLSQDVPIA